MNVTSTSNYSHIRGFNPASNAETLQADDEQMEIKNFGEQSPLILDELTLSRETKEKMKAEFTQKHSEGIKTDPFDNEFQVLAVQYDYADGTLEKHIKDSLADKAKNASLVAGELGEMIRGTMHNPDATVEERATNRETALKLAEQIAKDYFDDPLDAQAFLEGINRFAENDVLREKGYIALDNSDIAPFKSYESPSAPDGGISWNAFIEKYGSASAKEIAEDPKQREKFYLSLLQENKEKWSEDIIKEFDENEKRVTEIIDKVKSAASEFDITADWQRLLKAF